MAKVTHAHDVQKFTDIPNIGPAMEKDFIILGLSKPSDLKTKDAYKLHQALCKRSGVRQDPCVLDTFFSAVAFMNGALPHPWYFYTKERKKKYPNV
jgi:hypothetical protein